MVLSESYCKAFMEPLIKRVILRRRKKCRCFSRSEAQQSFYCNDLRGK